MSNLESHPRLAKAHQLMAELRTLQSRINATVDQLCELVGGSTGAKLLSEDTIPRDSQGKPFFRPNALQLPLAQTYIRAPLSGDAISEDIRYYSNGTRGLVQVVQHPLQKSAETNYSIIINFADFDGDWLSLVLDTKSLLHGHPLGRGTIHLTVEVSATSGIVFSAKHSHRLESNTVSKAIDVRANQICIAQIELGLIDPTSVLDSHLHLIFAPPARGSIEILRLSLSIEVTPEPAPPLPLDDVFE